MDQACAERIRSVFATIHGPAFDGDTELSTGIEVGVIEAGIALDTPTFILLTPWTINGLAFPPDQRFPVALEIDGATRPVYSIERSMLGPYRAVNLAPLGSHFPSAVHARHFAERGAPKFRRAVEEARAILAIL
ncbi:MAG TPA: hypothetical protein VIN63_13185 [Candidatus Limnocylindria bacterium]|jgi:hypothetical protein|nr:hypothetical protein [Chloroflexota bacterium]